MAEDIEIVISDGGSHQEQLAAKEIRRYLYLRTACLPKIRIGNRFSAANSRVAVATIGSSLAMNVLEEFTIPDLGEEEYFLKSKVLSNGSRVVAVIGGGNVGTLYGAYRFAELIGVRFYLHGDTIPDNRIPNGLPDANEHAKPLFNLRGIVPFHDFPEGPDWWDADDYMAVVAQLPKLRMNFIGLHTYPEKFEGFAGAEPTVWIGPEEHVNEDGTVRQSYASRHFTTMNDRWGYVPKQTSEFRFGADRLYDKNIYAADYMADLAPNPSTPEQCNELFDRFGRILSTVFTYAETLGVKRSVGTEIPLTIPIAVKTYLQEQGKDPHDPDLVTDVYRGIFKRIMQTHPLDYYWLWTHEHWIRGNTELQETEVLSDLQAAVRAANEVEAPFTLATSGWVLGPKSDRTRFHHVLPPGIPVSTLNGSVGFTEVDPAYLKIADRPKWILPWLEDDGAMILPQLWAGRIRRDCADASLFDCSGVMANHWRTRTISPNVGALASALWEQASWTPYKDKEEQLEKLKRNEGPTGGAAVGEPTVPDSEDTIYQTARVGMSGYTFRIPSGKYTVSLMFGDAQEFGDGNHVFKIDIHGQQASVDLSNQTDGRSNVVIEGIKIFQNVLHIEFEPVAGEPYVSGIIIGGRTFDFNQIKGTPLVRKINCGGSQCLDFEADMPRYEPGPRSFSAEDYYVDWARHEFGDEAADSIAAIFASQDGRLPRPVEWGPGPGGRIISNHEPWESVSQSYQFVDDLIELRPRVKGAGNLERYDYWLNQFCYLRTIGQIGCLLVLYENEEQRQKEMCEEGTPLVANDSMRTLQRKIINLFGEMTNYLQAAIRTKGELGTMANIQTQAIELIYQRFAQTGEDLPDPEPLERKITAPMVIVPTVRTTLHRGESLNLKVILLARRVSDASMYWRPLGGEAFERCRLTHVNRSVYSAFLDSTVIEDDFEYFIRVTDEAGQTYSYPATAPDINQTVVLHPDSSEFSVENKGAHR